MQWYIRVLKHYVDFEGRAHRAEYWFFVLFSIIISVVLAVIDGLIGSAGILGGLYGLGVLLPSLAVLARRLHDIDRTGWWILIGFVPLIGLIVLIVFACLPSTPGDNRFGGPAPAQPV